MQPTFDFDHFSRLARDDPGAFEAQRLALLEAALAQLPLAHQAGARVVLADVQLRMCRAASPGQRLAAAFGAVSESMLALQQGLAALRCDGR